ncbi:hypothetical protein NCS52_01576000 [Fusarium sp. LHS14.1]|nr:hypothetical protein NCS52_01576000 [Fusarium sp. LHS14.1]
MVGGVGGWAELWWITLDDNVSAPDTSSGSPSPRRCGNARAIVIELPQFKRFSTIPAGTLLEPLSTQGEVPGDCFPFHEDPNSQVHGPHPDQHEADDRISGLIDDPAPVYTNSPTSHPVHSSSVAPSNAPVTSYFALGLYDSPLPVGKYYPSNFENRSACKPMLRPSLAGTRSSNISPNGETIPRSTHQSHLATPETKLQRKLQQYQRDMIVQASMAARELLNNPATSANYMANGVPINSLPLRNARLPAQTPHKPRPPRLLPMDSPGPVTPMDLGAVDGGDYLSK